MHTHGFDENRPPTQEERLTAYLLGELPPGERADLERALAADRGLAARLEDLRSTLDLLRTEMGGPAGLSGERRAALRAAAARALPAGAPAPALGGGRRLAFRRVLAAAAVVAVAAGAVLFYENAGTGRPPEGAAEIQARRPAVPAPGVTARPAVPAVAGRVAAAEAGEPAAAPSRFDAPAPSGLQEARRDPSIQDFATVPALVEELVRGSGDVLVDSVRKAPAVPGQGAGGAANRPYRGPGDSVPPSAAPRTRPPAAARDGIAALQEPSRRFAGDREELRAHAPQGLKELGYAGGEAGEASACRIEIHDGYGRRYCDRQVLDYLRRGRNERPRDMFFRFYGDNPAVRTAEDAVSTFAADVDTASYPLVRNYLVKHQLPPKAAVRTEEFLNYFQNGLAPPREGDFAIHLEAAPSPFGEEGQLLLRVGIKAREVARQDRKPLRLVFVIDKSGSMASGARLELVKRALGLLIDQLDDEDQVGIVAFDTSGHRILDPTPGYERWKIRAALAALATGGSTNAQAGLVLGYEMAERAFSAEAVNRIVLCSDGVANTGETDQRRILDQVRSFSERQIDLTAVGVGMGNHNDVFLEQIADRGNGACHYVDDFEEARRVFVEQFTGTLQTIARDVKIRVEFDPAAVSQWRQLGYENRALADQDFRNDSVDAGEVGAGHEVVALYELTPAAPAGREGLEAGQVLATVRLRWFPDGASEAAEMERSASFDAAAARRLTPARFRLSAVAAQFAEVLRRSYWARGDSYAELERMASGLVRELPEPQVRELRDMIRRTRRVVERQGRPDELSRLVDEGRRLRLDQAELEDLEVRSQEVEQTLEELRRRNSEIELRIEEILDSRG